MPLINFETKADFDDAYRIGAEPNGHPNTRPEIKLHYNRKVIRPIALRNVTNLIRVLSLVPTNAIVLVGVGFGWSIEVFLSLGFSRVIGTDTSLYIQGSKFLSEETDLRFAISAVGLDPDRGEGNSLLNSFLDGGSRTTEAARVLSEDLSTESSRNTIKSTLPIVPNWVITENVLSTLSDVEAVGLSNRLHLLDTNIKVAHLDTTIKPSGQDPRYNWKTLDDWSLLLPNDIFIDNSDFRVIIPPALRGLK
jgi:hypothetical protein